MCAYYYILLHPARYYRTRIKNKVIYHRAHDPALLLYPGSADYYYCAHEPLLQKTKKHISKTKIQKPKKEDK